MSTTSLPAAASPPLPVARGDFPTWLPAMLVKELRQGLRTRGFVGAFIVFQVIMVLLMVGTVFGSMFGNNMTRSIMATTISGFFWTLLGVQLLLVTPARALATLQVELDSRSLDLLVLTRLTAWRIVLGKWGSLMAQALLLLVAMLPYGIVRYFLGSVDLVADAVRGASLIGGCALLTAAGLACSGMPKVVRVLVPIVFIMGFQIIGPLLALVGGRGGATASPFGAVRGGSGEAWLLWVNGALVLGIFLVTAVRRIAPAAENHVIATRGLALAALLPVPLLVMLSKSTAARGQLVFAAILLAITGAVEISSRRWPMLAHWRPWTNRGVAGRVLGRFALPGWQSAFAFILLAGALMALGGLLPGMAGSTTASHIAWLTLLGAVALTFPMVVLSFFGGRGRASGGLYFLIFAISSLVAAIAAALGSITHDQKDFLELTSVIPGAGFWITLFSPQVVSSGAKAVQGVLAAAVLATAWWQSRTYWAYLAEIDARVRSPKS